MRPLRAHLAAVAPAFLVAIMITGCGGFLVWALMKALAVPYFSLVAIALFVAGFIAVFAIVYARALTVEAELMGPQAHAPLIPPLPQVAPAPPGGAVTAP